jgi:NarL family two-component system response regulator LiaR
MPQNPVRVVVVNDFEVVVLGLARLLQPFSDRVEVIELDVRLPASQDADIVLYDTFGAPQGAAIRCEDVLADCRAQKLVVYTWNLDEALMRASMSTGISGYLSKQLSGEELADALERIHGGESITSPDPEGGSLAEPAGGDWPGRAEGLSEREAEILAFIVQGLRNQELADRAYLSINTVKSYIRSAYAKMGVTSRSQAVLWGIDHGFRLESVRIKREA